MADGERAARPATTGELRMSDPVIDDGQAKTSSASSAPGQPTSRVRATLMSLLLAGAVAIGVILGIGIGNLRGWDWALAGAGVLAASWLWSYQVSPTPWSARIAARLQPVAAKVGTGAVMLWGLVFLACGYVLVLVAPYSTGIQSLVVGSPLAVHVLIIVGLIVVTYHLLFPIIEPKRRAMLVWHFTQGRFTAKSLFALYFGLIVSTSIAVWDQLLLLLTKHDVVRFYLVAPKAGAAPAQRVPLTDLIAGNDIFSLLMWQLGDMVPTLKVNDTIGFGQPLFYTSSLAGWLVLAFKTIVGFALIGSVVAIIQAQRAKPDKPPEVSLLPSTTQRILHWRPSARRSGPDEQPPETNHSRQQES
jgi:hypothetical protein